MTLKFAAKISAINNHPTREILQENWQYHKTRPEQRAFIKISNPYIQEVLHDLEDITYKQTPPWQTEIPIINTHLQKEMDRR